MLENVGGPVPSQMLTNARRDVSECFPDVKGITSCTSEFIHDTRTEIEILEALLLSNQISSWSPMKIFANTGASGEPIATPSI